MFVEENYRAQTMAAGTSFVVRGRCIAGFLPTVNGTMTITDADGTALLTAFPVTAGSFIRLPIRFNTPMGGTVALTTAAGTLLI